MEKKNRKEIDVPDIRRAPKTPVAAEVILWAVLAVCVILFLCNISVIEGRISNIISRFFFGVFGVMAYVLPVLFFLLTAFLVANQGSMAAWIKTGAVFVFYVCICAFCELLSGKYDAYRMFIDYYEAGSELHAGGGMAGGLLCRMFCPIFGQIGAWICILLLIVICAIIITERSLFDNIRGRSKTAYRRAKEGSAAKKELHHLKKEKSQLEKRQRMQNEIERLRADTEGLQLEVRTPRRQQKVSGVITDTRFDPSLPVPEEMHEVTPRIRRSAKTAQEDPTKDREAWDRNTAEKKNHAEKDSRARKMVDSVDPQKKAHQMDLNFTIQRDGVSEEAQDEGTPSVLHEKTGFSAKSASEHVQETAPKNVRETAPEVMPEVMPGAEAETKIRKNPKSTREEQEKTLDAVAKEIAQAQEKTKPAYVFPPMNLLTKPVKNRGGSSNSEVKETALKLQQTLHNFGVNVNIINVSCGPSVTRYELMPEMGVKVSRILNLSDDIKLNLAAADIRIEAPIPGKSAVGIEVPNKENSTVLLRELLESDEFKNAKSNLSFAVGKDIAGKVVVADIAKMPHLLIAGATGSGKSVCINTLIMSILYKADPEDVKLIMIDPKVVELSVYNGIPHLFIPVVTDPKKASGALNWGVAEMTDRYQKFAEYGVRDLKGYNEKIERLGDIEDENKPKKLPQIVIIVDELADLMMVAPGEVEDAICRLAQLARAAGIHLIIATQRPSVNVITGLIKANMPSRIAFSVTSGVDSRTIIDMNGAEKLLGKGDMLFYPQGYQKPARVQGAFVSDKEVSSVAEFLTKKNDTSGYQQEMEERISQVQQASSPAAGAQNGGNDLDTNFVDAGKFIIEKDKASIGMLQRVFKIGFNRAARIMDQLSEAGVVGPEEGTKPRKVLMTMEEFEQYVEEYL
ncbi:MAG: DNA translocase FtsK [Eubacteriales bacterium]|nr:DNA translocase FtsK [Eubacteriales bacterium]